MIPHLSRLSAPSQAFGLAHFPSRPLLYARQYRGGLASPLAVLTTAQPHCSCTSRRPRVSPAARRLLSGSAEGGKGLHASWLTTTTTTTSPQTTVSCPTLSVRARQTQVRSILVRCLTHRYARRVSIGDGSESHPPSSLHASALRTACEAETGCLGSLVSLDEYMCGKHDDDDDARPPLSMP